MKFYKVPFAKPWIDSEENEAVRKVIESKWISEGENVKNFEKLFSKYVGVRHGVAVNGGTAALHAALAGLGIEKGDEVILPSLSFVSTANVVLYQNAKPIFCDVDLKTLNLDPEHISKLITKKTKAVIVVHYGGVPCEMGEIMEIAEKNNLFLIEDAAHATGGKYKNRKCGNLGHAGCFSFYPNKIITTGEGGMITTNDDELAKKIEMIRDYGQRNRYEHIYLGYNYHMTDMQAALGLAQLRKVDKILQSRKDVANMYMRMLSNLGIEFQDFKKYTEPSFNFFTILVDERDEIMNKLEKAGVETRICFPPIHRQPLYLKIGFKNNLPKTEYLFERILNIPIYPQMRKDEINYVIEILGRNLAK